MGSGLTGVTGGTWLNTGYGIWFNRRYRWHGALFQGDPTSIKANEVRISF